MLCLAGATREELSDLLDPEHAACHEPDEEEVIQGNRRRVEEPVQRG